MQIYRKKLWTLTLLSNIKFLKLYTKKTVKRNHVNFVLCVHSVIVSIARTSRVCEENLGDKSTKKTPHIIEIKMKFPCSQAYIHKSYTFWCHRILHKMIPLVGVATPKIFFSNVITDVNEDILHSCVRLDVAESEICWMRCNGGCHSDILYGEWDTPIMWRTSFRKKSMKMTFY